MNKMIKAGGVCFLFAALLVAFLRPGGGDVSNVSVVPVASDIYTEEEIQEAVDIIIRDFKKNWDGCTLTEIRYVGDEAAGNFQKLAEQYGGDQAIMLSSFFDVDASGGDGSLNPNYTYKNWGWTLVRDAGGRWRHVDHGYG